MIRPQERDFHLHTDSEGHATGSSGTPTCCVLQNRTRGVCLLLRPTETWNDLGAFFLNVSEFRSLSFETSLPASDIWAPGNTNDQNTLSCAVTIHITPLIYILWHNVAEEKLPREQSECWSEKRKKKNSKNSAGDLNPHDREMVHTSASSLQKHWPNQSYSGNVTWLHVPIDTGSILYARYLTLNGWFMRFNLHFFSFF